MIIEFDFYLIKKGSHFLFLIINFSILQFRLLVSQLNTGGDEKWKKKLMEQIMIHR